MKDKSRERIVNDDVELVTSVEILGCDFFYVTFHPHSEHVLSTGYESTIRIWSISDNDFTLDKIWHHKDIDLEYVEVHPQTHQILSCSHNFIFKVWDEQGNCVDSYTTKNEEQKWLNCHRTLPIVAIGCEKSLVILSLNNYKA